MNTSEDITIIETKKIYVNCSNIIEGVPDMGLVGAIAVSHIVLEQNFEEVGYIKSELFPPVMVVHERKVLSPVRIFQKEKFIVILSEIPIDPKVGYILAKRLTEWYKEKGAELIISISGTPIQERICLLYTSPSPRDRPRSRMPSSACKKKKTTHNNS